MNKLNTVFKAFADMNRIRIVKILQFRTMCVCELAHVLEVSQPAVSKQLKKLTHAGIVRCEQDGLWTNYYLEPSNEYAQVLLRNLGEWLADDSIIMSDLKKVREADRNRLCCRKEESREK